MINQITIKKAEPKDAIFLYDSLNETAAEQNLSERFSLTQEKLFSALFSEDSFAEAIIAFSNTRPIGFALFSITNRNFNLFDGPGIYVHSIYIEKFFRRKKVGIQLAHEIKKIAQERDCCRIDWVVLKCNKSAMDFCNTIADAKEVDYINTMRLTLKS